MSKRAKRGGHLGAPTKNIGHPGQFPCIAGHRNCASDHPGGRCTHRPVGSSKHRAARTPSPKRKKRR